LITSLVTHHWSDEDGLAHRQIAVRLGQVADELMPKDLPGLSTNVFTGSDVQVAAADPGVCDVHRDPTGRGFGHGDRPDGHHGAAFPYECVLLRHGVLEA
jgi:hypothetical protein